MSTGNLNFQIFIFFNRSTMTPLFPLEIITMEEISEINKNTEISEIPI